MYMEQIQIHISPAQLSKIKRGLPIQLKHDSMGSGDMVIAVHPDKAKKMMSAYKRGKGLRIQMDEDEVRASGLLGSLKKLGKKVEKGVVDAGNKIAKPAKKVISKIPKPVRDVLQDEAQSLIDTTGTTLGMLVGQATGDEELGDMINQGISDTGNELLSGKRLSLGSKILPIAKKSVNVVVDQIEDPQYRAVAKQIVKKSGAGLYGKAGAGLTGQGLRGQGLSGQGLSGSGLSGQGLSGSGMRKRYPAVMPRPEFDEEDIERLKPYSRNPRFEKGSHEVIKPYPRRMPRFEKGSQEAKDYMASIRNNKQGSGFFSKLGKEIKKGAKEAGKDFKKGAKVGKKALFGKRIGDEASFILPIAGTVLGGTAGSMAGGPFGSALGGAAGGAAGKALADDINKRGYGMKGKGRKGSMVRPASDMPTFSPYATLYSAQNHPFVPESSFQNGGTGERIM